jgi:phosphoglycerate dehydrogenase-like enzyme
MHSPEALDDLLPHAHSVVMTLPHTPLSEGMIDSVRLARFRRGAYLVNIGRGPTVVLDAVVRALDDGQLAGVALDVFEIEPLPAAHPLWRHPRALLTPHVAVVGPHIMQRRFDVLSDNVRRFLSGEPLRNRVDKALWY